MKVCTVNEKGLVFAQNGINIGLQHHAKLKDISGWSSLSNYYSTFSLLRVDEWSNALFKMFTSETVLQLVAQYMILCKSYTST